MISQHFMQSIGWALIHSLWQGLAIYLLVKIAYRFTVRADVRYGIGVIAMLLMVACFGVTLFELNKVTTTEGFQLLIQADVTGTASTSFLQTTLQFIDQNIIWLLRFWALGLVAGLLRIAAGLWYINRLRRNSTPVQGEWLEMVKDLATSLNITRVVTMAEAAIASPMVVGFVKPMILFPVGLLSGLTTEQVETILVHELSHIRRQDYIINLVQSVIETIFFFNPFTLLISALIREERENCCDDLVIAKGISPISYVKTLAQLESIKSSSTLALGIAGNQNQLLNRIKRIMENSAKNDWGKGRLVPVALLFLGLICASWLSIGSEKKEKNEVKQVILSSPAEIKHVRIAKDTPREEGLMLLKKRNDHGWVLEEPADLYDVPEVYEVPELPAPGDLDFNFDVMAQIPPMDFEMPQGIPGFSYEIFDMGDSIPAYTFRLRSPEDWKEFESEFREKFKSQFKDFYEKNQKQFDKMLDEMKKHQEEGRRDAARVVDLDRMSHRREMTDAMMAIEMARRDQLLAEQQQELSVDQLVDAKAMAELSRDMARMASRQDIEAARRNADELREQLRRSADVYEDMTRRYSDFQKALIEQLVADGYLKKGEEVDGLNINDNNEEMTINGKKIKEKDRIKYKALQDQYFKKPARLIPGRSE